jgi:putative toxin-antitoxin system antitoxin component (TIGR02293 family)
MMKAVMAEKLERTGKVKSRKRSGAREAVVRGKHHSFPLKSRVTDEESSIITRAIEVIGDRSEALRWMGTPVRALEYATPISLVDTAKGRRAVIDVLGRIEHGVL